MEVALRRALNSWRKAARFVQIYTKVKVKRPHYDHHPHDHFHHQFCDWEDLVFDRSIVTSSVVEDYQLICSRFTFYQIYL